MAWFFIFGLATSPFVKEYGEGRSTESGVLKYSRYLVAQATKLYMVVLNICGSSGQSLLHVTQLARRILRWLLDSYNKANEMHYF
jgi:hypothetical protein